MGAWTVVGDIAGWVAAGALLVVLIWAAIERGRMHPVAALRRGYIDRTVHPPDFPKGDLL